MGSLNLVFDLVYDDSKVFKYPFGYQNRYDVFSFFFLVTVCKKVKTKCIRFVQPILQGPRKPNGIYESTTLAKTSFEIPRMRNIRPDVQLKKQKATHKQHQMWCNNLNNVQLPMHSDSSSQLLSLVFSGHPASKVDAVQAFFLWEFAGLKPIRRCCFFFCVFKCFFVF